MSKTTEGPRTGAERQAAYAARRRRLTPLERELGIPLEDIYTPDELPILARIRKTRDQLLADCRRLNVQMSARMLADSFDVEISPDRRALTLRIRNLLARGTFFSAPVH